MRLIDIEAEVCADCVCRDKCEMQTYCFAKEMQTVDAVQVVRCRDCRSYNKPKTGWCEVHLDREHMDDFCSYGERKEGAD